MLRFTMSQPSSRPAQYVTKLILQEDGSVVRGHETLPHVIEYAQFHNLVLGEPAARTPYFSVQHADGSDLNSDELDRVSKACSTEMYSARIRDNYATKDPALPMHPEDGRIHSSLASALRSSNRPAYCSTEHVRENLSAQGTRRKIKAKTPHVK
jgi:hypothetical protein